MTTTDTGTALAVRKPLTLAQIAQRIDLNAKSGWGLENASSEQLNGLALYCQRHDLLPGEEVTLYEGRPWKTLEGCVTLMRRNRDEYRGFSQRPLTAPEKEAWGWSSGDIVVETIIRTKTYGDLKGYGRVSEAERAGTYIKGVRHNPVAQHHAVEIAQKRSLQRTQKVAFGTENFVDDEEYEDAVHTVIAERNDPERVARNSAEYDRTIGAADWGETPPTRESRPAVSDEAPADSSPPAGALVTSKTDPLWKRWLQAERNARAAGVSEELLALTEGVKLGEITEVSLEGACLQLESAAAEAQQPAQAELAS